MQRLVFLPGALGAAEYWHPVGRLLPEGWEKIYLRWPGLGSQAPDPTVRSLDDLVGLVEETLTSPATLVAQSMGGVVAIRTAFRNPGRIERLVLVATSGGVDVSGLGGKEWRESYRRDNPGASDWIMTEHSDHTADLPQITAPTLLIWGDSDPISPVAVGELLASLLPDAKLVVLAGGDHSLALDHPEATAAAILEHLGAGSAAARP